MKERIQKLREYAEAVINLASVANHKWQIVEPLGTDNEILGRIGESYGAHSFNLMLHTLLFDLVKDLAALTKDRDSRSPSLATIRDLLGDAGLVAALRTEVTQPLRASVTWTGGVPDGDQKKILEKLEARDRAEREARFDEELPKWIKDCDAFLASELAERLWKARSKTIAHYSMIEDKAHRRVMNIGDIGLKWGEPAEFLSELEQLAHRLLLLVSNSYYAQDEWRRMHSAYAKDMWLRLTGRGKFEGQI
jgi:hypothetical protein